MTAPKQTNAAARLHKFLTAAQSLNGATTHQQLSKAFELDGKATNIDLLRTLVQAAEALDEVGILVKQIPKIDHQLYLRGLDPLKTGLGAAAANSDFNQWKANYLRPERLQPLEFCAELLSRHYPEDEITPDVLQKIQKDIGEVYESVMASGINAELKATLLELLEKVRQAVHDYRMKGVYALKDALDSATGKLVLHRDEVQQARNSEQKEEVDKVFHLLEYLDKITAIATRGPKLLAPLLPHFPYLLGKGAELIDKLKPK